MSRGRKWELADDAVLRQLYALRPFPGWRNIGDTIERTPAAARQRAYELGLRSGGQPHAKNPCEVTGEYRRWGVKGCKCTACEARRSLRRKQDVFVCASCGSVNIVTGTGSRQRIQLASARPAR